MRYNANGQLVTTVNDLKHVLQSSVKPNNYRIELLMRYNINGFDSRTFNILVKSSTLPERRINLAEVWCRGRKVQLRSEQENSGEWECTVIDDNNMSLRKSMTNWFERIDSIRRNMAGNLDYMVYANIYQLDVQSNPVFGVRLNNVFLSSIGSVNFDDSSVDQLTEFPVTFSYSEIEPLAYGDNNSGLIKPVLSITSEDY